MIAFEGRHPMWFTDMSGWDNLEMLNPYEKYIYKTKTIASCKPVPTYELSVRPTDLLRILTNHWEHLSQTETKQKFYVNSLKHQ